MDTFSAMVIKVNGKTLLFSFCLPFQWGSTFTCKNLLLDVQILLFIRINPFLIGFCCQQEQTDLFETRAQHAGTNTWVQVLLEFILSQTWGITMSKVI